MSHDGSVTPVDSASVIATLAALDRLCHDGAHALARAAVAFAEEPVRRRFEMWARERAEICIDLEAEIRRLGGDPAAHHQPDGPDGAASPAWLTLLETFDADPVAVLTEAARGEHDAKAAFERALADPLPADTRALVKREYTLVCAAHDGLRDLSYAFKAP